MRDETGATEDAGQTGTIVEVRQGTPYLLCDVEYDARPGADPGAGRRTHVESELEPIEETASRVSGGQRAASGAGSPWRPTVGDRVCVPALDNRGATVTAIDERGDDTVCEVEYDHVPGELAEPRRGWHSVRELVPDRPPSAEALTDEDR